MARPKYLSLLLLSLFASCSSTGWWWDDEEQSADRPSYSQSRDRVYLASARLHLARGNSASARRVLTQLSPGAESIDVDLLLAESYLREGDLDSADQEIAAAAELELLDPRVDMLRGVLAESVGDWLEARKSYQAAALKDTSDNKAVLSLARVFHATGDAVRAASYLEREISVRPMDFKLSLAAGRAYQSVGSHFDAITHFSLATEIEPSNMTALESLIMSLSLAGQHREALHVSRELTPEGLAEATCLALGRSLCSRMRPIVP
jgi:Flp pilus assembly protein TadD